MIDEIRPTTPLVSVIIPTFDRRELVVGAVSSALGQTYTKIEVVVVDDGSTDGTATSLVSRFGDDPRLRIITQENTGVAAARNAGIEAAAGDLIGFLDSDDEWLPWKLELQVACLALLPSDIGLIWSDFSSMNEAGQTIHERHLTRMYRNFRGRALGDVFPDRLVLGGELSPLTRPDMARAPIYVGDIYPIILQGSIVHTSTVLLTRQRVEEIGGFDVSLRPSGEDFDYYIRAAECGRVAFVDIPTARYRVGAADQLTSDAQMVMLARNGTRAVEAALARSKDDERVSLEVVKRSLANAYEFLGSELADSGIRREGRRYLWRALRLVGGRTLVKRWMKTWALRRPPRPFDRERVSHRRRGRAHPFSRGRTASAPVKGAIDE